MSRQGILSDAFIMKHCLAYQPVPMMMTQRVLGNKFHSDGRPPPRPATFLTMASALQRFNPGVRVPKLIEDYQNEMHHVMNVLPRIPDTEDDDVVRLPGDPRSPYLDVPTRGTPTYALPPDASRERLDPRGLEDFERAESPAFRPEMSGRELWPESPRYLGDYHGPPGSAGYTSDYRQIL